MSKDPNSKSKHRSPSYPSIDLGVAVERVRELARAVPAGSTTMTAALKIWGYKSKTGFAGRTLAAILKYGLIEELEASGDHRKVKISDLGRKILYLKPDNSPERIGAIKEAALKPKIHTELYEQWEAQLPSDEVLSNYLTLERDFNPNAVHKLVSVWKETYEFANLGKAGTIPDEKVDKPTDLFAQATIQMPDVTPPPAGRKTEFLDLQIPLISGERAILRTPIPLSEEDYELLTSMLSNTLKGMRKAIVRKDRERDPSE